VFSGRALASDHAAVASAAEPPCSFPRSAPKRGQSFKRVLRNGSYPDASTEFGRTWLWDYRYGAEPARAEPSRLLNSYERASRVGPPDSQLETHHPRKSYL
jgi:hypothetical protein